MLGPMGSFLASLALPSHYFWAAHERRGIGLSYLFAMSLSYALCIVAAISYKLGFDTTLQMATGAITAQAPQAAPIFSSLPPYAIWLTLIPLACLSFAISLLNCAILISIFIGQPVNYLYGEALDFTQVLRVNCYIVFAAMAITLLVVFLLPMLTPRTVHIFFGLVVFYNFYAILFPKFDF
jgi:hypothetical protein